MNRASLAVSSPTPTPFEKRFEACFHRYARWVYGFFRRRGYSHEECSDLTQETFLRVYRGWEAFRDESSEKTWILSIAANVWRNDVRSRTAGKRCGLEPSLEETALEELLQEAAPLDEILDREISAQLRKAIQGLPDQMRHCLLLRLDQKLKYHEIATVLRTSIQTVKSQLHRAKERLRREMAAYHPELCDALEPGSEARQTRDRSQTDAAAVREEQPSTRTS